MELRSRRYFDFHEAPEDPESGVSPSTHGVTPVWGFGTVVASTHPAIHSGERVYGYLAPTRFLVVPVSLSEVNRYTFTVSRPHLPAGTILLYTKFVSSFTIFRQKALQSNYQMFYGSHVRSIAQRRESLDALPPLVLDLVLVRGLDQFLAVSWCFQSPHFVCIGQDCLLPGVPHS